MIIISKFVDLFKLCLLFQSIVKLQREVTEVADQLARCYAMMGAFSESAQYLKVCLPAIQER